MVRRGRSSGVLVVGNRGRPSLVEPPRCVATLYTFGFKRGVGVETLSEFFARLRLETQVGCSPSALRHMMQVFEVTILETAETWQQEGGRSW